MVHIVSLSGWSESPHGTGDVPITSVTVHIDIFVRRNGPGGSTLADVGMSYPPNSLLTHMLDIQTLGYSLNRGIAMTRPTVEASPGVVIPRKYVIPPAVLAIRMQRYSIVLMVVAFILLAVNFAELSLEKVLWFAAILIAVFAILCAVTVVILNAIAWNFDRLREELKGGRDAQDMR